MVVAVLVDGDNISGRYAGRILAAGKGLGDCHVIRAYADVTRGPDWTGLPGFRLIHAGTGKNAADLLLALDAMELALLRGIRSFVLASSDGDFTHLAQRLREMGALVVGMGEAKAPAAFRAACSDFITLGAVPGMVLVAPPKAGPAAPAPPAPAAVTPARPLPQTTAPSPTDQQIRAIIRAQSPGAAGILITRLGADMHRLHGFQISTTPERTWRKYLAARPGLYDLDPRGPDARVRYRPDGFSAAA